MVMLDNIILNKIPEAMVRQYLILEKLGAISMFNFSVVRSIAKQRCLVELGNANQETYCLLQQNYGNLIKHYKLEDFKKGL
jgi:hypothetical protein